MFSLKLRLFVCLLLLFTISGFVHADDFVIDKIYHPYVRLLGKQLELRMIQHDGEQKQQLSYAQSLSDRLSVEGYLITKKRKDESFVVTDFEIEVDWQLTEQGEYDTDWGIVTELEHSRVRDESSLYSSLVMERQWGRWAGTANLWAIYEWGDAVKNELDSTLALQLRYRYSRYFEPAVELYSGENTRALGPVAMGELRLGTRKRLHWEMGIIFGLDNKTPNQTFRFLTEFEF